MCIEGSSGVSRHKMQLRGIGDKYIMRNLTFKTLVVSLRTTRFNVQKILHGARFALSILYGSQHRERLLLYTSLTDWWWKVFTARYGLIPYIKQITFSL